MCCLPLEGERRPTKHADFGAQSHSALFPNCLHLKNNVTVIPSKLATSDAATSYWMRFPLINLYTLLGVPNVPSVPNVLNLFIPPIIKIFQVLSPPIDLYAQSIHLYYPRVSQIYYFLIRAILLPIAIKSQRISKESNIHIYIHLA